MNNTEGPRVEASQHYGKLLQQRFPDIPIDFQDERLTTVEAHRMLVEEADISRAKQKKLSMKLQQHSFYKAIWIAMAALWIS